MKHSEVTEIKHVEADLIWFPSPGLLGSQTFFQVFKGFQIFITLQDRAILTNLFGMGKSILCPSLGNCHDLSYTKGENR